MENKDKQEIIFEIKKIKKEHRLDKYIIPIAVLLITSVVNLFFYNIQNKDLSEQEENKERGTLKAQALYDFGDKTYEILQDMEDVFLDFCFTEDTLQSEILRIKLSECQEFVEKWESRIDDTTLINKFKNYQSFIIKTWHQKPNLNQTELKDSYSKSEEIRKEIKKGLAIYMDY